jgi:hypothetical protein
MLVVQAQEQQGKGMLVVVLVVQQVLAGHQGMVALQVTMRIMEANQLLVVAVLVVMAVTLRADLPGLEAVAATQFLIPQHQLHVMVVLVTLAQQQMVAVEALVEPMQ